MMLPVLMWFPAFPGTHLLSACFNFPSSGENCIFYPLRLFRAGQLIINFITANDTWIFITALATTDFSLKIAKIYGLVELLTGTFLNRKNIAFVWRQDLPVTSLRAHWITSAISQEIKDKNLRTQIAECRAGRM